jgi:hypothetical protein
MILASLKSLLETGHALEETRHWPKQFAATSTEVETGGEQGKTT